jgi:hypothetical protein
VIFDTPISGTFMLKPYSWLAAAALLLGATLSAQGPRRVAIGDWPEMRGPNRDGR